MSDHYLPERIVDQLRDNLRMSGIPATEEDIQGLIAKGFLSRMPAFEELMKEIPCDIVPDYLADWGPPESPPQTQYIPAASHESGSGRSSNAFPTLIEMATRVRNRQVSPVELTEQALQEIDRDDPALNAFQLILADRARAAALQAEQEIACGDYRGPLHGIPIALKDLMALAGTPTTAGSKILDTHVSDFNADSVERLEAAGAVIIGKTRMSEFAYSPGSNNPHYGPTCNPWNDELDAGGSSSGSAAAVATGMVYAAIGSDTGGSIRIPAAFCGIVGLKPTFGRISLHGVVPLSWSLDHLGPLTRSVADAALLLVVLSGTDPHDPRTRPGAPGPLLADLNAGVAGLRIGMVRDDGSGGLRATSETVDAWKAALQALAQQGAELVEVNMPEIEPLQLLNGALLALEATTYHQQFLHEQLDDYGEFVRHRLLAAFAYESRVFVQAQQARQLLRQRCNALFERVDLLSTPTQPDVAPQLSVPGWTVLTGPFNSLGWPAISLPSGLSGGGLPLGIQLMGKPWDEATVLRAAHVVEAALGVPPPPKRE
ncbi:MAG: amidase [Chloroflexales bacterium]|nr:amidase [Chloroflexales bacterium]